MFWKNNRIKIYFAEGNHRDTWSQTSRKNHTFKDDFQEFLSVKDKGLERLFEEKLKSVQGFIDGTDEPAEPSSTEDYLQLRKEYVIFSSYPEIIKAKDFEEKKI